MKAPVKTPVKKSNPFGNASAVDTASKLAELDLKKKEAKVEVKKPVEKVAEKAPEKKEEPVAVAAAPTKEKDEGTAAKPKEEKEEKKRREPEKVNTRAAAFESAPVSNRWCRCRFLPAVSYRSMLLTPWSLRLLNHRNRKTATEETATDLMQDVSKVLRR